MWLLVFFRLPPHTLSNLNTSPQALRAGLGNLITNKLYSHLNLLITLYTVISYSQSNISAFLYDRLIIQYKYPVKAPGYLCW